MRAIGYLRVSTDEQASSGLGLEAQRSAIAAAAARMKVELVAVHVDEGVSGATEPKKRPALSRALEDLVEGDVLLVAKRDRLGRHVLQVGVLERELADRGVRVVSAAGEGTDDDEPSSVLMRRILDAFAEYELSMIRSRTKKALGAARARGKRAGSVPFGYRALEGGRLEEDLDEQATLVMMRELRDDGRGYRAIALELERRARRSRGTRWWPESVRTILKNARKA